MADHQTEKKKRLKELTDLLNRAGKAYYQDAEEIMSNYEYDALYDELEALEKELGMVLSNSPTVNVGYEVLSELPKERHESPMLSLDKTKDIEELKEFAGDQKVVMSWKMDGLTVVLTYRNGELVKAVTRGTGEVGEVITNNARVFKNIPLKIAYQGELILRGEAVIGYRDFERINEEIPDADAKYKNPRNLCSGSVRQLNNEITAKRNVNFFAFALVKADGVDFHNSRSYQLDWLKQQGFDVVEHHVVTREKVEEEVIKFSEKISQNDFPSDGLVLIYDDIGYGQSLGRTSKFPRDSFAFKWADETKETVLEEIEWSPSRTGLINPVAIFDPVELEGTTVNRASLHNVSIFKELKLGMGDEIVVYKANAIIPQIRENLTQSNTLNVPSICPVCQHPTIIQKENDSELLICTNPYCKTKLVKRLAHFVSRKCMNIDNLSEETLSKFVDLGWISNLSDIYNLSPHFQELIQMEGFGDRSVKKLQDAIENSKSVELDHFIAALSIPGIGSSQAKVLASQFKSWEAFEREGLDDYDFTQLDGFGLVLNNNIHDWFKTMYNEDCVQNIASNLHFIYEEKSINNSLSGKTFVITGSLNHFTNREVLKNELELRGAKVSGSVSAKTDYLVNNDINSNSSKNQKAKKLNIPIISENQVLSMLNN